MQVRISRSFFLLELLRKTDLFLKRGAGRGGERGGVGEENLGHLSPWLWLFSYIFRVCDMQ